MGLNFNPNQPNFNVANQAPAQNAGMSTPYGMEGGQLSYDASQQQFGGDGQPNFDGQQIPVSTFGKHPIAWTLGGAAALGAAGTTAYALWPKDKNQTPSTPHINQQASRDTTQLAREGANQAANQAEKAVQHDAYKMFRDIAVPAAVAFGGLFAGNRMLAAHRAAQVVVPVARSNRLVYAGLGLAGIGLAGAGVWKREAIRQFIAPSTEEKAKKALENVISSISGHQDWETKITESIGKMTDKASYERVRKDVTNQHKTYLERYHAQQRLEPGKAEKRDELLATLKAHQASVNDAIQKRLDGLGDNHSITDEIRNASDKAYHDSLQGVVTKHLDGLHQDYASQVKAATNRPQHQKLQSDFDRLSGEATAHIGDTIPSTTHQEAINKHRGEKVTELGKANTTIEKAIETDRDAALKLPAKKLEGEAKTGMDTELVDAPQEIKDVLASDKDKLGENFGKAFDKFHEKNHHEADDAAKQAKATAQKQMELLKKVYAHRQAELAPVASGG